MSPKKKSKPSKDKSSTPKTPTKKMGSHRKDGLEEVANQLADDLAEFLTSYSEHVNINNYSVQTRIEELAEAVADSMSDYEDEEEDEFLSYEGDMDQYDSGDEDD